MTRLRRGWLLLLIVPLLAPLLACTGGVVAVRTPRWACPSPTPLPWGLAGPVKEVIRHTRPISEGGDWEEEVFYELWEREYPSASGPPFPSPTPYASVGTNYVFGQRVEIWPVHVIVAARSGPAVEVPGIAPGTQQLYFVEITWHNHALEAFAMPYAERVRLRAITSSGGPVITDSRWGVTALALQLAGGGMPSEVVPPGESQVRLPIIAPRGEPETVEVVFEANPTYVPAMPTITTLPGTPTATPAAIIPSPTPAPNDDLRAGGPDLLTVQWANTTWRPPGGYHCEDPGALTDWEHGEGVAWGHEAPLTIAAPPGADRLIQIALNQVGKRYVWGAKGPETFDCSGLTEWAYAQIGIRIPRGTAGQWPTMRPVERSELRAGDLIFFDIAGRGRIDHVGMLLGDLNGDGRWDMVHAASPALGVRVDHGVFESAYYQPRIRGFRTAR